MKYRNCSRQSGFTLIELSIVLVIIGLLLGGVLKGQAMIDSARVKALTRELQSIPSMMYAYQDKFKYLPGDDSLAASHVSGYAPTSSTGQIDTGPWIGVQTVASNSGKGALFWQHVRLAELAGGSPTQGNYVNAAGGYLGVIATNSSLKPAAPATAVGLTSACASQIPGKLAKQIDVALDDGAAVSGSVYAMVETSGPVAINSGTLAAYADTGVYTVCYAF
jgi:prepilin-type N-terminal cleavage/methylation domain-containing protein